MRVTRTRDLGIPDSAQALGRELAGILEDHLEEGVPAAS
jgi:hypothetical protein